MASFEKKIEMIQKKPPRERKMIALFLTGVIFIVLMVILYVAGAFRLAGGNGASFLDPFSSIIEETSSMIGKTKDDVSSFTASTTATINELKDLASTTASIMTSSTEEASSTDVENETATTSSEDGASGASSTSSVGFILGGA